MSLTPFWGSTKTYGPLHLTDHINSLGIAKKPWCKLEWTKPQI